jgi:hypothetical protein
MRRGKWSADEDATLREMYAGHTRNEIAARLGRSEPCVRSRCWILGLNSKRRPWTNEDLAIVRRWYEERRGRPLDLKALAVVLGRSDDSIAIVAGRRLGLAERSRKLERRKDAPKYATDEARRAALSARQKAWIAAHGHPRGYLGHKHGPETRALMSAASRAMWANPNSAIHSELTKQGRSDRMCALNANGRFGGVRAYSRAKSGRRPDLGGRYFRSAWEANYARFLEMLKRRGEISAWEYETQTFMFEAIKRGTRSYTPDFKVIYPDGRHEWHEVKGWMDAKSATRIKRMAKYYPKETIRIVGEPWFKAANTRGLALAIPGWEFGKGSSNTMPVASYQPCGCGNVLCLGCRLEVA